MPKIQTCRAREIIDSRAEATIEVELSFEGGGYGLAQVESGASVGSYEMHELRDGDLGRLKGRGVKRAVENINQYVMPQLQANEFSSQRIFDQYITGLDGTPNLERFGANAVLGLSIAFAQAMADRDKKPLYAYFGAGTALPQPIFTIFNGGKLAAFSTDTQEFNIVVKGAESFSDALRIGTEIYHAVGTLLHDQGFNQTVGDEGGYSVPGATTDQAMELIVEGAKRAGYSSDRIGIILDEAASNLYNDAMQYHLKHHEGDVDAEYLIQKFEKLAMQFPLVGLEDGLADQDWNSWIELTKRLGSKMLVIGDDIFSTNALRLRKGANDSVANAIMIKPTQIGTITRAIEAVEEAKKLSYVPIISHRSGDTENTYIAHLAVGMDAPYIKCGAPARGERVGKYNELLRIQEQIALSAV